MTELTHLTTEVVATRGRCPVLLSMNPPNVTPPAKEAFHKVEVPRSVFLIVTDGEGAMRGLFGGLNPLMADLLLGTAKTEGQGHVQKVEADKLVIALGQDCFHVSRDFLLHSRALFFPALRWDEIEALDRRFPSGLLYWLVISY